MSKLVPKYLFGSKTKKSNEKRLMLRDLETLYGDKYNESTRKLYESAYKKNKENLSKLAEQQRSLQLNDKVSLFTPTVILFVPQNPSFIGINSGSSSWDNLTDEEVLAMNRNLSQNELDRDIIGISDKAIYKKKPKENSSTKSSSNLSSVFIKPSDWKIVDVELPTSTFDPTKAAEAIHARNAVLEEQRKKRLLLPSTPEEGSFGGGRTGGGGAEGTWGEKENPAYLIEERTLTFGGDTRTFNQAFAEARKKGLKTFEFNGKLYGTELGNNPNWKEVGDKRKETTNIAKIKQRKKVKLKKSGGRLIPKAFLGIQFGKSDVQKKYEADRKAAITSRYGDLDKKSMKWAEKDYDKGYLSSERGTNFNYTAPTVGGMKADESGEDYFNRFKQESGIEDSFNKTLNDVTTSLNNREIDRSVFKPTTPVKPNRPVSTFNPNDVNARARRASLSIDPLFRTTSETTPQATSFNYEDGKYYKTESGRTLGWYHNGQWYTGRNKNSDGTITYNQSGKNTVTNLIYRASTPDAASNYLDAKNSKSIQEANLAASLIGKPYFRFNGKLYTTTRI